MSSDTDISTKNLFANFVLCRGSTMFPGIADRMQNELTALASLQTKITVIAPPERKHSAWKDGATMAYLSSYPPMDQRM